jgi:hypothetical protein
VFEEKIDLSPAVTESAGNGEIKEEFAIGAVGLLSVDKAEGGGIEENVVSWG